MVKVHLTCGSAAVRIIARYKLKNRSTMSSFHSVFQLLSHPVFHLVILLFHLHDNVHTQQCRFKQATPAFKRPSSLALYPPSLPLPISLTSQIVAWRLQGIQMRQRKWRPSILKNTGFASRSSSLESYAPMPERPVSWSPRTRRPYWIWSKISRPVTSQN